MQVAGNEIELPSTDLDTDGRLKISEQDGYVILDSTPACGLKVAFAGEGIETVVTIVVDPKVTEEGDGLYGLCGAGDGVPDDMRTADGTDVSGQADRYRLISDSYVVYDEITKK